MQILAIFAVLLAQAGLICWLIYEHRRRHRAEIQSRNAMTELTYMNRMAAAGQLSASIAHEVNQPLAGIATRASAALRWLRAETPNLEKAGAALEQIVTASHRAGDIVTSVRAMFRKDTSERLPIDINKLILTVLAIVRIDLQKNGVELQTQLDEKVFGRGRRQGSIAASCPEPGHECHRSNAVGATSCVESEIRAKQT